jgi:hypothetical protein
MGAVRRGLLKCLWQGASLALSHNDRDLRQYEYILCCYKGRLGPLTCQTHYCLCPQSIL